MTSEFPEQVASLELQWPSLMFTNIEQDLFCFCLFSLALLPIINNKVSFFPLFNLHFLFFNLDQLSNKGCLTSQVNKLIRWLVLEASVIDIFIITVDKIIM